MTSYLCRDVWVAVAILVFSVQASVVCAREPARSVEQYWQELGEIEITSEGRVQRLADLIERQFRVRCPIRWQFYLTQAADGDFGFLELTQRQHFRLRGDPVANEVQIESQSPEGVLVTFPREEKSRLSIENAIVSLLGDHFVVIDGGTTIQPVLAKYIDAKNGAVTWTTSVNLTKQVFSSGPSVSHGVSICDTDESIAVFGNAETFFYGFGLSKLNGEVIWAFHWFVRRPDNYGMMGGKN